MSVRRVEAVINLSHFAYNFKKIRKIVGPKTKVMTMIKGNAYGHGDIEIAKSAVKLGAEFLGVACLYEAQRLRAAKIKIPILLVGYTDPSDFSTVLDLNLDCNIMESSVLKLLDRLAKKKNKTARIHVKINTGMNRLGISPEMVLQLIPKIPQFPNVRLVGIYSHFSCADEKDLSFTHKQLKIFTDLISQLSAYRLPLPAPLYHIANSAAVLRLPESHLDMVRPGKILYGIPPSLDFKLPFTPKPVLSLKTQIVQIRKIKKGETVGYNRKYKAQKDTVIATIPVGYADGFRRTPQNWGRVLVRGKFAPLVGRVSMDQSAIDITQIARARLGDEVVLIGHQKDQEITAWDVAKALKTSCYEVTAALSSRVERVYVG